MKQEGNPRIILPLEQAVRDVYSEMGIPFPERNSRRTVLYKANGLLAGYSTKEYPIEEGKNSLEVLRLSRLVETKQENGSLGIYCALGYRNGGEPGLLIDILEKDTSSDIITSNGKLEALQMLEVISYFQDKSKMMQKYHGKRGQEITPELLRNLVRDYMGLVGHAIRCIKPVTEKFVNMRSMESNN